MSSPKTVRVRARAGLRVPLPLSVRSAPGAQHLFLTDEDDVELPRMAFVLRRLRAGDLVVVDEVSHNTAAKPQATVKTSTKKGDE